MYPYLNVVLDMFFANNRKHHLAFLPFFFTLRFKCNNKKIGSFKNKPQLPNSR